MSSAALVLPASPVQAAEVDITIVDADGDPIERAMVAFVDADGVALAGAIADENGEVTLDDTDAAGYVASAPGFATATGSAIPADDSTITLTAAGSSSLSYSNAYGAQVSGVFADGEPGVFYITTDGIPSVWRTMDYAGTWAPVPTTASSDDGIPQSSAGGLVTSGVPGEVGVVLRGENNQEAFYYSTDFGTTWASIALPSGVNNPEVRWAHSIGDSAESSVVLVAAGDWSSSTAYAADLTVPAPVFGELSVSGILDLGAADGKVFMVQATTTNTVIAELALSSGTWGTTPTATLSDLSLAAAPDARDSLEVATMQSTSETPDVVMLYEHTSVSGGHTGDLQVAVLSGTWTVFDDLAAQGGNNDNPFDKDWDETYERFGNDHINYCGENGTGTAISIAPTAGVGAFEDFGVIGTVGNCMWALNLGVSTVDWPGATSPGSAPVTVGEIGVVYLDGINNNTGFAWSAGYNFSDDETTGDMVAIAPNEAGIAKSANILDYRPQFGSRGAKDRAQFVAGLAQPGRAVTSGGIAINGLTAAVVRDIVMDPNDATGTNYAIITSPGGGSRVMLTTDGGESFSTVTGAGGESMAWWNADGIEMMAAFAGLNGELAVKPFERDATGDAGWQMGEEFAMDAATRETDDQGFAFGAGGLRPATAYDGTNRTYLAGLAKDGGGQNGVNASAMVGVTGTNRLLIAGSRIASGGGSVDAEYSAGSVGIVEFAVDATTKEVTVDDFTIYGKNIAASGGEPYTSFNAAGKDGAYDGGVTSMSYCPSGSAASVEDAAFITVKGSTSTADDGLYRLSDVSGAAPAHSAVTGAPAFDEVRIDCSTGLIVGVVAGAGGGATPPSPPTPPSSPLSPLEVEPGVYVSTDGESFVRMNLTIANPDTLDVQADADTGEVTMVVAGGNGDVTSVEMDETDLGVDLQAMKDAPEGDPVETPDAPIDPPADGVTPLNDSTDGINTGGVADIELPSDNDDIDVEEGISAASVRRAIKGAETATPVSIGSSSGAFESTVGATSGSSTGGGTTAGNGFAPIDGVRPVNTRDTDTPMQGETKGYGTPLRVNVGALDSVPSDAAAVAVNITATNAQEWGFVAAYPCASTAMTEWPGNSNVNFDAGATVANSAIVPLDAGYMCLLTYGKSDVIVDVVGYMAD